jgi:hypothetical protein
MCTMHSLNPPNQARHSWQGTDPLSHRSGRTTSRRRGIPKDCVSKGAQFRPDELHNDLRYQ